MKTEENKNKIITEKHEPVLVVTDRLLARTRFLVTRAGGMPGSSVEANLNFGLEWKMSLGRPTNALPDFW